ERKDAVLHNTGYSDCTITFSGRTRYGSRASLAVASPYFYAIFREKYENSLKEHRRRITIEVDEDNYKRCPDDKHVTVQLQGTEMTRRLVQESTYCTVNLEEDNPDAVDRMLEW